MSSKCRQSVVKVAKVARDEKTVQVVNVVKAVAVVQVFGIVTVVEAEVGVAEMTRGRSRMPEASPVRSLKAKKSEAAAPRRTSPRQNT